MFVSYDDYRIFYHAARYGNLTQAAELLLSSQPNVTRSIRRLEEQLGVRLFERSNRGVRLTPEGEKLYARVSVAVEQIQLGEEELARERSLESGSVSIGATETAMHGTLLPVLQRFHADYPGVRIRISYYSTPQALSAVRSRSVDFAVITSSAHEPDSSLRERILLRFREHPVCGDAYDFLAQGARTLEELSRYPLISLGRDSCTYAFYNELFLQRRLCFQPDIEAAITDQILPMVACGLGIGFVPDFLLRNLPREHRVHLIALNEPIPFRYISLVQENGRTLNTAATRLISYLPADQ